MSLKNNCILVYIIWHAKILQSVIKKSIWWHIPLNGIISFIIDIIFQQKVQKLTGEEL